MARLLVLALCVSVLEFALASSLASEVLSQLSVWHHLALFAAEALYCSMALGVGAVIVVLVRFGLRQAGVTESVARFVPSVGWFGLHTFLTLAWYAYYQTGNFPTQKTVRFAEGSVVQVVQHAFQQAPFAALTGIFVALFGGPLLFWFSGRLARRGSRFGTPSAWLLPGILIALASVVIALRRAPESRRWVVEKGSGAKVQIGKIFDFQLAYGQGVFSNLAYSLPSHTGPGELAAVSADVIVERRKQISLARYQQRIASDRPKPYNVIVLLVESMRNDVLARAGKDQPVVMENLTRLAREGLLFTRAYTQASHSDAADPCPLSGQGPIRGPYGSDGYREDPKYPRVLIYDLLDQLGYRTALISSQNETWGGMIQFLDTGHLDFILHSETYDGPTYVPERDETLRAFLKGGKKAGKIDDRHTVSEAIRWIGGGGDPFFLYMNLQNSHFPYETPADFPRRFSSETDRVEGRFSVLSAKDTQVARRLYWDSLRYVDHQIGRLIDHLRETGQLQRTILVITGDTGQAFMEHGFATHAQDLYDEVMRVPLLILAPGVQPGVRDDLAQHIDVPRTILGLLGLPPHPSFHGRDLLDGSDGEPSVYLSVRTLRHQAALVKGNKKLIYDFRKDRILLYDLAVDPEEHHDLSRLLPTEARELLGQLNGYLSETLSYYGDPERLSREYPPVVRGR